MELMRCIWYTKAATRIGHSISKIGAFHQYQGCHKDWIWEQFLGRTMGVCAPCHEHLKSIGM